MTFSSPFKNKEHLRVPYLVTFSYIFLPMLFSATIPGPIPPSGSPVSENLKSPVFQVGMGGPEEIEEYFDNDNTFDFQDHGGNDGLGFMVQSGVKPQVSRINFLNYSNARLPVDDPTISSDFGWRTPPCKGCSADHKGVDFVPGAGSPIYAILDGMVVEAGYLGGYGYWVKLEHLVPAPDGSETVERWESIYAHMQEDSIPENVKIGAVVSKGDRLGRVGNTGMSTGAHLHFEIRIDGENYDPMPLVTLYQNIELVEADKEREGQLTISYR